MLEVRLIDANGQCVYAKEIEAEPVRRAYWEPSEVGEYHCTNCGAECDIDKFHKALLNLFCGKCGARMDGGGILI